jgi:ABC-2 type transport system permease protein
LFASTALAPLEFMAGWLKVIASLNPLTYAIEPIRYIYQYGDWAFDRVVMHTPWLGFSFGAVILVLLAFDALVLFAIQPLLRRRFA